MDIRVLEELYSDILIYKQIPVPEFIPEKGVHLVVPGESTDPERGGELFIGTDVDFNVIKSGEYMISGATYLFSTEKTLQELSALPEFSANLLFLACPIHEIRLRLYEMYQPQGKSDHNQDQLFRIFWENLKAGQLESLPEMKKWLDRFPHPTKEFFACITIKKEDDTPESESIDSFRSDIRTFFPEQNFFFLEKECVVLFSQDTMGIEHLDLDYDAFSDFLKERHLIAGTSYCSRWPAVFYTLYRTAHHSMKLGERLRNPLFPKYSNLFGYHEYESFYTIHLAAENFRNQTPGSSLCYLIHPDVLKIYQNDENNSEHLIDILLAYLMCGSGIDRTAKMLFMHRNTLYKKLNRIQSILNRKLDTFEDPFTIQFSCMMVIYQMYYKRKKIYE